MKPLKSFRYFIILLGITVLSPNFVQAHDHNVEKIQQVFDFFRSDIEGKYKPEEVLVLFDLDGTLIMASQPNDQLLLDADYQVEPRGSAMAFVDHLHKGGYKKLISSAHKNYAATLHKVVRAGFAPYFGIGNHEAIPGLDAKLRRSELTLETATKPLVLTYFTQGDVVSARNSYFGEFYAKAAAPYVKWGRQEMSKIKRVIIVEDSDFSMNGIHVMIKNYEFYENAQIDYFMLGSSDLE